MSSVQEASIESIMTSPVFAIRAEMPAMEVLQLAETSGFHHFPLVAHERLVGLVCTCDLEDVEQAAPVMNAVRRPPVAVDASASGSDVMRRMSDELVGSVLVVKEGVTVGIVTREDLARAGVAAHAPNFQCDSCGAVSHLRRDEHKGTLCLDCRSRATPATREDGISLEDETGSGD